MPHSATPQNKPQLLIADDSAMMRSALCKMLTNDYDLLQAEDGLEAWQMLHDNPIQLLVTDLEMPNLNGYGLLERLRASQDVQLRQLPALVVSAHIDSETVRQDLLQSGATEVISKPFNSNLLRQSVQKSLEQGHPDSNTDTTLAEESAVLDPLTGLANSHYFSLRGEKDLAFSQRHNKDLSLILVHMDHYKSLEEQHGKAVGGQLIKKLGHFLINELRKEDTVARLSHHDFGLIATMSDEFGGKELATRILNKVRNAHFRHQQKEVRFSISISLAAPHIHSVERFSEILELAKERLSIAIKNDGNQLELGEQQIKEIKTEPEKIKTAPFINTETMPLEAALWLLKQGQQETIQPHIKTLTQQVLPLLNYMDQVEKWGMENQLALLQKKLRQ
ncbi:MAG: diguanylate cyclase [Gammaproteobacteria bacterium]|nr:diguanylate cyclase [Gammaproteobacteria bacterium]